MVWNESLGQCEVTCVDTSKGGSKNRNAEKQTVKRIKERKFKGGGAMLLVVISLS